MKFVIVFVALFAVAMAASVADHAHAETLRYDNDVHAEGFKYDFETSDGKAHQEHGVLKNVGTENEAISVTGSFHYVGEDGVTYTVNYVADENGFQPSGEHIPHV